MKTISGRRLKAAALRGVAFFLLLLGVTILPIFMNPPSASAGSDTYPTSIAGCRYVSTGGSAGTCDLKDSTQDEYYDPWSEENRECTSYVAWMLSSVNGFTMPFFDNAANWGSRASGLGYTVNMTPAVGSVYWTTNPSPYGHVAWVEAVSGSTVTIEDYNSDFTGHWAEHTGVATSSASGYIHFKDVSSGGGSSTTPKNTPLQYNSEMDVFKRGSDTAIWQDTIQSGSNSWGGWHSLGGGLASNPSADQYGVEMDVFAINPIGQIWQDTYQPSTNSWNNWQFRANNMAGDPASIVYNGKLYVFSRGTDGNLYVTYWNGNTWVGPNRIGGNGTIAMGSSPTVTVYGSEMDVYIRGSDSNLWKSGTGDGVNFGSLGSMGGGNLENDPKAITYDGEMDVYANTTSGTLVHDTWLNGWSGFKPLTGGTFVGSPTAMQYGSNEMDVYDRGVSDSYIYQNTWQAGGNSWSGWISRGGIEQGDPTALQWGTEMDVYATNYANQTDKDTFNPSTQSWGGFLSLL